MQTTPTDKQISDAILAADAEASASRQMRQSLKRRKTPTRRKKLERMRERCADAAEPLRSYIGMVAWHDLPLIQEMAMKSAVHKLRYERRQIDKMLK